jgi:hypothetical protein
MFFNLEDYVPQDHLLRCIHQQVDFSFIYEKVQQSLTDSDSGMLSRPNKPKGFHYLAQTSVDTKKGIITDIQVTAGNFNDHEPYIGRMAAQQEKFGLNIQKVYDAKTKDCKACPLRDKCFGLSMPHRKVHRPLFHEALDRNKERAKIKEYKAVRRLRNIWCEGTFGTLKSQHNLIKTFKRGLRNVSEHCLFSALALNLKRMLHT